MIQGASLIENEQISKGTNSKPNIPTIDALKDLEEVAMFDLKDKDNLLKIQKETAGKKKGSKKNKSPTRGGSKPKSRKSSKTPGKTANAAVVADKKPSPPPVPITQGPGGAATGALSSVNSTMDNFGSNDQIV